MQFEKGSLFSFKHTYHSLTGGYIVLVMGGMGGVREEEPQKQTWERKRNENPNKRRALYLRLISKQKNKARQTEAKD